MTPTEVWEGFNPVKEPLETSIISSEEKDNVICQRLYFTSENTEAGRTRVFSELYYDKRWQDDRPAILLIPSLGRDADYSSLIKSLLQSGYVVSYLDYAGTFSDGATRTTYPDSLSFASYPTCNDHLFAIEGSARRSPWFEWSKVVRRAISMLGEHHPVDPSRIAVMGIVEGAQIAWQVAGMDGRIASLVAVNGGGYLWRRGAPRFTTNNVPSDDDERAFSTGVGAETYARFVSCPTCFVVSSNSKYTDVDRAGDIISLVSSPSKALMISRGTDEQFNNSTLLNLLKWLKKNFAHDTTPIECPTVTFEEVEGKLSLRLKTSKQAKTKILSISYGEPFAPFRFWNVLPEGQKIGKHEYSYSIPVYDPSELIVAFASVSSEDIMLSSPVVGVVPSKLGITDKTAMDNTSRIIYNGSMGLGNFSASSRGIFLDDDVLTTDNGPFNLTGISVKSGSLVLYRGAHEIYSAERDAVLQMDAYSAEPRRIHLNLLAPDMKFYTTEISLKGLSLIHI